MSLEEEMIYVGDTKRFHKYQVYPGPNQQFTGGIYLKKVPGRQPPAKIKVIIEEVR